MSVVPPLEQVAVDQPLELGRAGNSAMCTDSSRAPGR